MVDRNGKGKSGSSRGLNSRDNIIEAEEDKGYLAALNTIMIEATSMAVENIAHGEATGICPIEAEALAPPLEDDGDDAPTLMEWILWYAFTKKEARSCNTLLERHKVTPSPSDEEEMEMRQLAQLRREIELYVMADELMSTTEWMEMSNSNDLEDGTVGDLEDESVSDSEDESEGESDSDDDESEFAVLSDAPVMECE